MYGSIDGMGLEQLAALVLELTKAGMAFRATASPNGCWTITITGY